MIPSPSSLPLPVFIFLSSIQVDEASMLDLPLAAALLDALPPHAQVGEAQGAPRSLLLSLGTPFPLGWGLAADLTFS